MKTVLGVLIMLLAHSSVSFAGRTCRTLGFSMHDGMAIPVVECSGVDMDSAIMNSFGGGSLSSWGMRAQQSGYRSTGDERYKSALPNESQNSPLFNPLTVKSLSSAGGSQDMGKSIEKLQTDFQNSMVRHKANLAELDKQYAQANMAQQQARQQQLAGLAAGIAMQQQLIRMKMFGPMKDQIEFEKNFGKSFNETFGNVESSLLNSLTEDVEGIDANDNLSVVVDQKRLPIDPRMVKVADQIKDRARKYEEFTDTLPNIVDASLAMINSSDVNQKNQGVSVAALALASANALGDGKVEIARSYATAAATVIDIAVGFVPMAGSINDLSQIAFGLATGRDYTGAEMTGIDYGLRAFGAVIGIFPAATLGKIAITAGFLRGAEFIRSSPRILSIVNRLRLFGDKFGVVVEVIGSLLPTRIGDLAGVASLRALLPKLFSHSQDIIQRLPEEKVTAVFRLLRDQTVSMRDRWQVLSSFEVGTIDVLSVSNGTSLFRWSSEGELGRYFSRDLISDQAIARELLALPPSNTMTILNEYKLTSQAEVISGKVARNFGRTGGATQFFLKSGSLDLVRTVK